MKKYCVTLILFFSVFTYSQTDQERNSIVEYYKMVNDRTVQFDTLKYPKNEKQLADIKAISMGIPLKRLDPSGKVAELVRFHDNKPIYYSTDNIESANTINADIIRPGGSMNLNLSGLNMIAGVWDQNHPRLSHNGFKFNSGEFKLLAVDGNTVESNHSTHVTGTVLSTGTDSPNLSGRGIAYNAKGWVFNWTNDMSEMNEFAGLGLLISNHSYGVNANFITVPDFGAYNSDSNALDVVCYNNPKYLPIFAAGNDRNNTVPVNPDKLGNDLLSYDKTAKNGIVVGAVNSIANYSNANNVIMSSFSSYGPTDDFRIKPDLVANGVNVYSNTFNSDTTYGNLSGTSMAAPSVTGALLLVQQFYGAPFMNSSTLKGLALHTTSEAGPADGPDHMFGWGLLNTAKMVQILQKRTTESIVEEKVINNGETFTMNVLALGNEPLKASISWTDIPGIAATGLDIVTPRIVNDLDIKITKQQITYLPWMLNKDWNNIYAVKANNDVDPFERVDIDSPIGIYQITVSHKGRLLGAAGQNYSLIVSGIDTVTNLSSSDFDLQTKNQILTSVNKNKMLNYLIQNLETISDNKFSICDINGRIVHSAIVNNSEGIIDLSQFGNGLYFLNYYQNGILKVTKKIIL